MDFGMLSVYTGTLGGGRTVAVSKIYLLPGLWLRAHYAYCQDCGCAHFAYCPAIDFAANWALNI